MTRSYPWQSYRQVATQTASPGQLVLMLYDGALKFLEQARTGFVLTDPQAFHETINNNIIKAQAIINELSYSLNMRDGGEFAARLRGLYDYFDQRLMQSNLRKDQEGIEEVIGRLTVLRDSWAEMMRNRAAFAPAPDEMNTLSASV